MTAAALADPRRRKAIAAALAVALGAGCAGCSVTDTVATGDCPPGQVCPGGALAAYCDGAGPPVLVSDGQGQTDVCTGTIAASTFGHALCVCDELTVNNPVVTDSFDSALGPYSPGGIAADVGINGKLSIGNTTQIGGALTVAGTEGISATTDLEVARDLRDAGRLVTSTASVTVGGNTEVAGSIDLANLSVAGALTVPADQNIAVSGALDVGASVTAPVAVSPPCECDVTRLIDVSGVIEAHRFDNHDADIGLDPDALSNFDTDQTLALPCGLFFLNRIQGPNNGLHIQVSDRTALFVAAGVTLGGDLLIEVGPDAELDLFVSGNVNVAGAVTLRSERPARARLYVGDAGAINFSARSTLSGNLYAPLVDLFLSADTEVFGSVFVNHLLPAASVAVHYDISVRSADETCAPPLD